MIFFKNRIGLFLFKFTLQAIVAFSLFPVSAFSFPEMVRHQYANCTTCHVNQNGGGILTEYGRALSTEVLATWGEEGEEQFLYGAIKPPKWLNLGGNVRFIQTVLDTPSVQVGQFITMQADLEAAVTLSEKLTLVGTIGREELAGEPTAWEQLTSRRHYLSYQIDDTFAVRAGKYLFAYGLRLPDHAIEIKRGLNWDQGTETYNIEGSYISDDLDLFATLNLGRIDESELDFEKGVVLRGSHTFSESYKLGMSYFYGSNDTGTRHVYGPYGILGFTERFYLLAELDFQSSLPQTSANTFGLAQYSKLGYEFVKGLHAYFTNDLSKLNLDDPNSLKESYGIGVLFYPRPHYEIQIQYNKLRTVPAPFNELFWVMAHVYL